MAILGLFLYLWTVSGSSESGKRIPTESGEPTIISLVCASQNQFHY